MKTSIVVFHQLQTTTISKVLPKLKQEHPELTEEFRQNILKSTPTTFFRILDWYINVL